MTAASTNSTASRGRPRLVLLGLALAFLAPVVLAIFLNSRWTDWQPEATRNYGDLIRPAMPLAEGLREVLVVDRHWTLLTLASDCSDGCDELVDRLDRLDRALGRHAEEVRQVLLAEIGDPATDGRAVDAVASPAGWPAFVERLEVADPGAILIDPLGNAMMTYPQDFDASRIKKDLDRLLRYSKFNSS